MCEHVFVSGQACILHADLDAFYASVEQRDDPRLRGRPVIVGGGVVLSASYEARACGVRTAMGGRRALALCREAVVVHPRMSAYSEASRAVFAVFRDSAPVVEGLSIDEAFLDTRGLEHILGSPVQIGQQLRVRVREEVGLPLTVGIATSKFVAKVASGVAKPDGLLLVEPGRELEFLHPLAVERLWGVGKVTSAKLRGRGLNTVADVAALGEPALVELLGRAGGRHLHALAHARDPRRVRPARRRRSVGAQRALGRGHRPRAEISAALLGLVDRVSRRLRKGRRSCRTVVLRLRFGDYARATRSRTMPDPTDRTIPIRDTAQQLLDEAWPLIEQRGLTLIGVALTNLSDARDPQLTLPFGPGTELDAALDGVRERFGSGAITRAALLGQSGEDGVPILSD
ncbi:MAG TPA: DNA polymerase IV [Solirubrobacteraceae bacterium]|nr:DNA polymerase IV [Solirubrobacteraceae bacterium]